LREGPLVRTELVRFLKEAKGLCVLIFLTGLDALLDESLVVTKSCGGGVVRESN